MALYGDEVAGEPKMKWRGFEPSLTGGRPANGADDRPSVARSFSVVDTSGPPNPLDTQVSFS